MPTAVLQDRDVTAEFPRRPRPGIVMGLRGGQVALVSIAVLTVVVALFTGAFPGPARGLALGAAAACVVLAFAVVEGRPGYGWLATRASHWARTRRGDTAFAQPVHVGSLGRHPQVTRLHPRTASMSLDGMPTGPSIRTSMRRLRGRGGWTTPSRRPSSLLTRCRPSVHSWSGRRGLVVPHGRVTLVLWRLLRAMAR